MLMKTTTRVAHHELVPFLKWAGGKRWLVQRHGDLFPKEYSRYIEPFLGGAAVFFHLRPENALLSDVNIELISTYQAIKSDWQSVIRALRVHQTRHSKKYYYEVRGTKPRALATRAARFLYLNRTCWNGLYRVNLLGKFNVPIGTKTKVLLDSDDFQEVAARLDGVSLESADFESSIDKAVAGDFVFVDPPYTVKHNNNGFLKYNDTIFLWKDQIRLRDALVRADSRGAKFLVTNANHKSVANLYADYERHALARASVISGPQHGRGSTEELIIRNY